MERAVVERFDALPGVSVSSGAPQSVVVTPDRTLPVAMELVDRDALERRLTESPAAPRFFVVNAVLDDDAAARLEDAGVGYVDATGRRWLPGRARTRRSVRTRASAPPGLRPPSVRLGQILADHPDEEWTERRLAARAETTQPTAHRLLRRLEAGDLVERRGSGRGSRRLVTEVAALRRWLAREGRPRRIVKLACFLPDTLRPIPPLAGGRKLALTGALAAERLGFPVITGKPLPVLRVEADGRELEEVPEALGGFRTDRGANLTLIADPHRLAFSDWRPGEVPPNAPPSRVMLDLYLESRGEAAVDVFLGLWGSSRIEL